MRVNRIFLQSFIITLLVMISVISGFAGGYLFRDRLESSSSSFPVLDQAHDILLKHGLKDSPPAPVLEYGMIRGMLQAYDDPYTSFIEPVQNELDTDRLEGKFGGIGVQLSRDSSGNAVVFPLPDGPAAVAGLLDGDRLYKVDELVIDASSTNDQIEAALRGEVGQEVSIIFAHPPEYAPLSVSVPRAEFPLPSVTWHLDVDQPRLGVVKINIIAATTSEEIQRAFSELNNQGAQVYVLDLRDNFGGLLESGIDSARLFLRQGDVIQQQYKGKEVETFQVTKPGSLYDIPLAVLINQHTASAAEIIAGALQAQNRAKLIGIPSFGKDSIQLVFNLQTGASLHVTAARWWVPGLEQPVSAGGLQPDILVTPSPDTPYPDLFLQAAASALLSP